VAITDGDRDILLVTSDGKAIRFHESEVRPMGRTASGVRGIKLAADQRVIALIIVEGTGAILTATENGYGKRTPLDEHGPQGRGGQGLIAIRTTERNGAVVGALQVEADDEIMLITDGGTLVRTRVGEISVLGRNTQGVKLISLSNGERLSGLDRIVQMDEEPGPEDETVH
jgi:DNA gyrase subunit A